MSKDDHEVVTQLLDLPALEAEAAWSWPRGLRHLPNITKDAFFELYVGSGGIASKTTLFIVIKKWTNAHALKTRRPSQHVVCNECCRFQMARSAAATPAEHKAVREVYKKDLDDMFEDHVDNPRCVLSKLATSRRVPLEASVLPFCLDAMDQSELRVPVAALCSKAERCRACGNPTST